MGYFENKVLDFMKQEGSITVKTCEQKLGTTELRKFISNLRDRGYNIGDVLEEGLNRFGIPTRWKRYFLLQESEAINE